MKAISILRSDLDSLPCDAELLKILNNVCDTCNFIVSGHDCWFGVSAENDAARERFASTGLLIAGDALYSLMKSGAVHFLSGVLSAVPKELKAYQLWDYVPKWETAEDGRKPFDFKRRIRRWRSCFMTAISCASPRGRTDSSTNSLPASQRRRCLSLS